MVASLQDVLAAFEELVSPSWAERGDPVGLVVGDPGDPHVVVERVLFAVDPVEVVVREAAAIGAQLVVTHHPLLFRPVHTVAADAPKGRVIQALIRSGTALYCAHTNADAAPDGVSDALGAALGLEDRRPLVPAPDDPLDKLVTFVPRADADRLIDALAAAGAGRIGAYDRCAFSSDGTGTFRPLAGAHPAIGRVGRIETVSERRVEMVLRRSLRPAVVGALGRPIRTSSRPSTSSSWGVRGWSRFGAVGRLRSPEPLRVFAERVANGLPATGGGIRVSGDLERAVATVAVMGGAGDSMLDEAMAAGVDAYVTSDLRHHPASEFREQPRARPWSTCPTGPPNGAGCPSSRAR